MRTVRWLLPRLLLAVLALLAVALAVPGSPLRYLAAQGYYQAELLWGRQDIDVAIAAGHFNDRQLGRLELVPEIKAYGKSVGLSSTDNYSRINPTWKRTIWNVSACEEFAFTPRTWWFPIVGEVPYLGYFQQEDARGALRDLEAQGYDARMRTAGAYSTLGWFEDPILVKMLSWSEASLADTILHELTHATVWIPGSVTFNESLANFVGEQASRRYLVDKYGEDGKIVVQLREKEEDRAVYRRFMHEVYGELDALYKDPDLTDDVKRQRKAAIFAALPVRIAQLDLHARRAYVRSAQTPDWNNAKMMSFKRYNDQGTRDFEILLAVNDGDLGAFLRHVEKVTKGADNPTKAVKKAAKRQAKQHPEKLRAAGLSVDPEPENPDDDG